MKWFGYETDTLAREVENRHRSFRVLGLRVAERGEILYNNHEWTSKATTCEFWSALGGTVRWRELYNRTGLFRRTLRVLGVPLYSFADHRLHLTTRVLGLRVRHRPNTYLRSFLRDCRGRIDPGHDDVYLLILHLGDAFNNLTLIRGIIARRGSRRPLLVVFSASFYELIEMMCPDLPHVLIDSPRKYSETLTTVCAGESFRVGRQRFFILFNDWFWITTIQERRRELGMSCRRMEVLADCYRVGYDPAAMGRLTLPEAAERSMLDKCREGGLDVDNFVFLAPEAFTEKLYDQEFWAELIRRFTALGYEVFANIVNDKQEVKDSNYLRRRSARRRVELGDSPACRSFYLTITEVLALAHRARRIVAIRSGMTELLTQCGVRMDVLYPGTNGNVVERTMRFYRLDQYPLARTELIYEYNMALVSSRECLEEILRDCPPSPRGAAEAAAPAGGAAPAEAEAAEAEAAAGARLQEAAGTQEMAAGAGRGRRSAARAGRRHAEDDAAGARPRRHTAAEAAGGASERRSAPAGDTADARDGRTARDESPAP